MKISLIMPAKNEEKRIPRALRGFSRIGNLLGEIIVVSNDCNDRTEDIVKTFAKHDSRVKLISAGNTGGKGGAILRGIAAARFELIGYVDADNGIPADQYMKLYRTLIEKGCDAAIASRRIAGGEYLLARKSNWSFFSMLFNLYVRALFGLHLKDTQCGAKLFRKEAIQKVAGSMVSRHYDFDVELLWRLSRTGARIVEVPVKILDVPGSKFTFFDGLVASVNLLRLRLFTLF